MEHKFCASYKEIGIRPLRQSDIELVRTWRNDKQLSKFLTPIRQITQEMQEDWFKDYRNDSDTVFFAVEDLIAQAAIGTVALYGFEGLSCSVGKIVIGEPSARGKGIGYQALLMALCVGISEFHIEEFRLWVHEDNAPALNLYRKVGFEEVQRREFYGNGFEIGMVISSLDFRAQNDMLDNICLYREK